MAVFGNGDNNTDSSHKKIISLLYPPCILRTFQYAKFSIDISENIW